MKKLLIFLIIQGIVCIAPICPKAYGNWTVELLGGDAYCLKMPLRIQQSGYEDIEITAKYATHSFQLPIYYSIRVAKWNDTRAWELELVHLKLDLTNKPAEVQRFEVSHGYNLFTVNRAWTSRKYIFRLGAGIIIAHPESTVREQSFDEHGGMLNRGYYISGPTAQAAVGRRFYVHQHVFLAIEGKVTGTYARVPIADGHATVPNVAIHGLFGFGYEF
jgi:hypothetical protein